MILQETADPQEVRFIGREEQTGTATATFTDELTGVSYSYSVNLETETYFTCFEHSLSDLVEDRNYLFKVEYSGRVIYLGKVFCTNQTVADYSINNGVYTEPTDRDNEFIVL